MFPDQRKAGRGTEDKYQLRDLPRRKSNDHKLYQNGRKQFKLKESVRIVHAHKPITETKKSAVSKSEH